MSRMLSTPFSCVGERERARATSGCGCGCGDVGCWWGVFPLIEHFPAATIWRRQRAVGCWLAFWRVEGLRGGGTRWGGRRLYFPEPRLAPVVGGCIAPCCAPPPAAQGAAAHVPVGTTAALIFLPSFLPSPPPSLFSPRPHPRPRLRPAWLPDLRHVTAAQYRGVHPQAGAGAAGAGGRPHGSAVCQRQL